MKTIGVIPARYASSRFPGKPLALIDGKPLIERVWSRASLCRQLDEVIIATDDRRIRQTAEAFGAHSVMTSAACASGTDRIAEVARKYAKDASVFINIQGDEPLISPALIDRLVLALNNNPSIPCVTAAYPINGTKDAANPDIVKVVTDENGCAMYFSRSPVPYARAKRKPGCLKHLGIYGYRRQFLLNFARWKPTRLEQVEMLEQLRILEKGYKIKVVASPQDSFGVDVPGDIEKIETILRKRGQHG
ncbi:MAG: hypothetical protein A2219_01880 [Elusimicrobia bacterium RIFOXYA2_FULL_50_26]|nr:MAG: hypothetical protein A2219_01880 [Elusimicrobia bacterium RIFOXYA2_FULL_50_26]